MRICEVQGCGRRHEAKGYCNTHNARLKRTGKLEAGKPVVYNVGKPMAWLEEHADHDSDDCLIWPFGTLEAGYGTLLIGGHRTTAHRAMCWRVYGPPSEARLQAAHSCNNRRCCNPRHLRWATPVENHADKIIHGTAPRGAKNPNATISEDQAREIIRRLESEKPNDIALAMGISSAIVSGIAYGCSWTWLSGIQSKTQAGRVEIKALVETFAEVAA